MNQPKNLNFNPMSVQFSDTLDQALEKTSRELADALSGDFQLEGQTHAPSAIIDTALENLRYRLYQKIRTKQG